MSQQQAFIMENIVAMRKMLKRKAYESDSDSSIDKNTNRGYKLKRKARFVKQGRLAPPTGPGGYKEIAEHGGFQRAIINENPPLIDKDGYEVDSEDDEERVQEAIATAMEENPYASVHIEHLLAPLTTVTDLPTHPTLSRPFTSKALTELVEQGCKLMHRENTTLWKAKPLMTRLVGDNTWAPCGMMIEPSDHELFTDAARFLKCSTENTNDTNEGPPLQAVENVSSVDKLANDAEAPQSNDKSKDVVDEDAHPSTNGIALDASDVTEDKGDNSEKANGDDKSPLRQETESKSENRPRDGEDVRMTEDSGPSNEGEGRNPATTLPPEEHFIHPLFLAPRSAHPDRDLGLPEQEAEDVRRLLQLWVQKQDEVARGTKKLYEGLLKADRLRKTVLEWAKAEAHCGPNRDMSDGEDWYDKEAWGLTEDLKKGEDEVEEDTTQTQKKTRNRK